jgi:hypothetical protein
MKKRSMPAASSIPAGARPRASASKPKLTGDIKESDTATKVDKSRDEISSDDAKSGSASKGVSKEEKKTKDVVAKSSSASSRKYSPSVLKI